MSNSILAIDLETTANGYKGDPKACYRNNKILAFGGWSNLSDSPVEDLGPLIASYFTHFDKSEKPLQHTITGHNLKFDLGYLLRDYPKIQWHRYKYWCTQTAEYLLSGHKTHFISLEDLSAKYRGTIGSGVPYKKRINIGDWLNSGRKMEDISLGELKKYVLEDAKETAWIAEQQMNMASVLGMYDLILVQSSILPAYASIELNGMHLNIPKAQAQLLTNDGDLVGCKCHLETIIKTMYPSWSLLDINKLNITANRTVSAILTGVPETIEVGKRKADKLVLKFDKPLYDIKTEPMFKDETVSGSCWYSTDEETLSYLINRYGCEYSKYILRYRSLVKENNTYIGPLLERAKDYPDIYTNINTTVTNTGRTSSSSPNFQNMPETIRPLFDATHEGYVLCEFDFKQLELCTAAHLSGDKQLIWDLSNGVDIHYEIGRSVFGWTSPSQMEEKTRRQVKNVVFGMIYGGGAKTLAAQAGIEVSVAHTIIAVFYSRYEGVKDWHNKMILEADSNAQQTTYPHSDGALVRSTMITIEDTKRRFYLEDQESPAWIKVKGKPYSFPPTKIKNYKSQGFAGGDIVPMFLKLVYSSLGGETSNIRLGNVIHDSIVVKCPKDKVGYLTNLMKASADKITEVLELKVPLKIELKSSNFSWSKESV